MNLLNPFLNRDWTWFGAKRFRPAPDQDMGVLKHIKIVLWGSLQTTAFLYLGLYALYQIGPIRIQDPSITIVLTLVWALVALHLNFHVYLWNRRALTLQNMAKTPLERFYLSQDISIPMWDTLVEAERKKEEEQQNTTITP